MPSVYEADVSNIPKQVSENLVERSVAAAAAALDLASAHGKPKSHDEEEVKLLFKKMASFF